MLRRVRPRLCRREAQSRRTKGPAGPLAPSYRRLTDDLTALGAHTTVRGGQNTARVCERAPTQQGPPATKTRRCASRSSLFATFCQGQWAGARSRLLNLSRPLRKKKGSGGFRGRGVLSSRAGGRGVGEGGGVKGWVQGGSIGLSSIGYTT